MYIITRSEARKIRKRMKRHKKNVTVYNRLKAVALRGEGKTRLYCFCGEEKTVRTL